MQPGDAPAWLLALEQSGAARAMRESFWLYPAVETLHILGFVFVVGGIAVLDARLMGLGRQIALRNLIRITTPVALAAFAVTAPTGALLFITEASAFAVNPMLPLKLGLIGAAGLNALLFHTVTARRIAWNVPGAPLPLPARLHGTVSILCWAGALVSGRLLAYV